MKEQHTAWEKMFTNNVINKSLISKMQKQFIQCSLSLSLYIYMYMYVFFFLFKNSQKLGRRPKQTFFQRRYPDVQQAYKKCSILLISRETQIKTTDLSAPPFRMAIIKKFTKNKCWRGCGEKGTLLHCWQECNLVQPL